MSRENVEVLRAALAALNAGDMNALRDLYHRDAIARPPEGWPEPGPFVGREAIIRQLEQMRATWDTEAVEPISDFIDVGDRVVLRYVWRGTGHGPESKVEVTCVVTLRKAKILTIDYFWDHAEALEAAGFEA